MSRFLCAKNAVLFSCLLVSLFFFSANAAQAATFTVSNVNDSGAGSLRQAIINSNTAGGINGVANIINFNIAGGIVRDLQLTTALPNITYDLTINGTTMAGYNNAPLFHLIGGNIAGAANGLTNRQGVLTVKALSFSSFGGNAIESKCAAVCNSSTPDVGLNVLGCFIGTDRDGVSIGPNEGNGIYYQPHGVNDTMIGGPLASERNIISGNHKNGILLRRPDTYFANLGIVNNYIGVNVNGTGGLGNTLSGIAVEDTIGAGDGLGVYVGNEFGNFGVVLPPTLADRNIISSNGVNGIFSTVQQTFFQIQGNYIGTNGAGTIDAGNTGSGIKISGLNTANGVNLKVGGALAVEANVISGNSGYGVESSNAFSYIQGNRIGTNAAGTAALGNTLDGVRLFGASSYVGGSNRGRRQSDFRQRKTRNGSGFGAHRRQQNRHEPRRNSRDSKRRQRNFGAVQFCRHRHCQQRAVNKYYRRQRRQRDFDFRHGDRRGFLIITSARTQTMRI